MLPVAQYNWLNYDVSISGTIHNTMCDALNTVGRRATAYRPYPCAVSVSRLNLLHRLPHVRHVRLVTQALTCQRTCMRSLCNAHAECMNQPAEHRADRSQWDSRTGRSLDKRRKRRVTAELLCCARLCLQPMHSGRRFYIVLRLKAHGERRFRFGLGLCATVRLTSAPARTSAAARCSALPQSAQHSRANACTGACTGACTAHCYNLQHTSAWLGLAWAHAPLAVYS